MTSPFMPISNHAPVPPRSRDVEVAEQETQRKAGKRAGSAIDSENLKRARGPGEAVDRHFETMFELAEQAANGAIYRIDDLKRHVSQGGSVVALELLMNLAATVPENAMGPEENVGTAAVAALEALFHAGDIEENIKAEIREQAVALKGLVESLPARAGAPMVSFRPEMSAFLDAPGQDEPAGIDPISASVVKGDAKALARLVALACSDAHAPSAYSTEAQGAVPLGPMAEARLMALVADQNVDENVKTAIRAAAYAHYNQVLNANVHGDHGDAAAAGIPFALLYLAGGHVHLSAQRSLGIDEQAALVADYRRIGAFYNNALAGVMDWSPDPLDRARMVEHVELGMAMNGLRHAHSEVLLQLDRGKLDPATPRLSDAVAGYDDAVAPIHDRLLKKPGGAAAVELAIVHDGDHWGIAVFQIDGRGALDVSVFDSLNRWGMNLGANLQDDTPNACALLSSLFAKAIDRHAGASQGQPLDVPGVFRAFVANWHQLSPAQRDAMVEVERATMLTRVADEVRARDQAGARLVTQAEFAAAAA